MRIVIEGSKVQEVGYRALVTSKALRYNPKGFDIRNFEEREGIEAVEVLIDSSHENVNSLYEDLKRERPEYAVVSRVGEPEPYRGYIPTIDKFVGTHFPVYIAEQMYKFVQEGKVIGETLKSLVIETKGMGEGVRAMGEGVRAMGEGVKSMGEGVKSIGEGVQEILRLLQKK